MIDILRFRKVSSLDLQINADLISAMCLSNLKHLVAAAQTPDLPGHILRNPRNESRAWRLARPRSAQKESPRFFFWVALYLLARTTRGIALSSRRQTKPQQSCFQNAEKRVQLSTKLLLHWAKQASVLISCRYLRQLTGFNNICSPQPDELFQLSTLKNL